MADVALLDCQGHCSIIILLALALATPLYH